MKHDIEAIWRKFSPQLKHFILCRVSDESVADDILQETFKKIHSHIETLKDPTKIEHWIYQIARNTIIDHYRTQKFEEKISPIYRFRKTFLRRLTLKPGITV